ncbi:hypothetical protein [Haloarcula rara]|uniref:hypothetical protein n=1 Tax=Haloarcula rara TaxID=3033387 RepID=UPI0023E7833B|nr:hypothetical protein [Halomicroarcula sp. SHR3]
MAPLPVEVLLGISHGLLMSLVPVVGVGAIAFAFQYVEGTELAPPLVVVCALPLGFAGGIVTGLINLPTVAAEPVAVLPRLLTAALVIGLVSMYANSQASKLAERLPRDRSQPTSRERPLAPAALEAVDGKGHVTISAVGDVRDVDGYSPLQADLRAELADQSWQLPADIPIVEMEARLEDRLRSTYDLPAVDVSVDARGTATIAAAPPSRNLAGSIPDGWRAVSVETLLPTGLSVGDEVTVTAGEETVDGVVLGTTDEVADDQWDGATAQTPSTGGRGLATVAVPTIDASTLLESEELTLSVKPAGAREEFRAFSLLVRAGHSIRKVLLDDRTRKQLQATDEPIEVLALRAADDGGAADSNWTFSPGHLNGDAAFVLGDGPVLDRIVSGEETVGVGQ